MKKILLLNGGKQFAHSDGRYNATLHDTALAWGKVPVVASSTPGTACSTRSTIAW